MKKSPPPKKKEPGPDQNAKGGPKKQPPSKKGVKKGQKPRSSAPVTFNARETRIRVQTQADRARKKIKKEEVIGSETIGEKISKKVPWLGAGLRKPKIKYPQLTTRRLTIPMPAKTLTVILIYVILFLLQTGIVYMIYRDAQDQLLALGADSSGNAIFLYPSINDQFILEGIVASILIFLCSSGFILLYQASKHQYNQRMAVRILAIGWVMVIGAFIFLQVMVAIKTKTLAQTLREIANQIS